MATRPGRPSLHEDPISSHYASDVHYVTGRRDPSLRSDVGAGMWNSKPKTAAVIAQYAAIRAALGPARFYPGPNATNHLVHYLNNSGRRYTIDLEDMVQSVPTAKRAMVAEFRQAQRFLQQLPFGRHYFTSQRGESSYNYQAESADWFFAIGGYTYWGKGEARITPSKRGRHYVVDFTYCFYDRYNWDGGKSVTIAGHIVTDKFMGEFHRQGLAREFDCYGSIKRRFEWDGDMAAPDEPTILKKPGR